MYKLNKIVLFLVIMLSFTACVDKELAAYNVQKNMVLQKNADSLTTALINNTKAFQIRIDSVTNLFVNTNNLFLDSMLNSMDSVYIQLDTILGKCYLINKQVNGSYGNTNFTTVNIQVRTLYNDYDSLHTAMNVILTKLNLYNMNILMENIVKLRGKIDTVKSLQLDTVAKFAGYIYTADSISLQLASIKTQVCYCYNQLNSKSDNLYVITWQVTSLNEIFENLLTRFNSIFEEFFPKKEGTSSHIHSNKSLTTAYISSS